MILKNDGGTIWLRKRENICEEIVDLEPVIDSLSCVHSNMIMQGRRKVFYISDIHCNMKVKKGFEKFSDKEYINHVVTKMNGDDPFGDNPLIIVGDIDCDTENVDYFFSQLRMRREGIVIFVLGNHEIWACDMPHSDLDEIIEKYRFICKKHDVIMLQNELAFFYDDRTGNGELLSFHHHYVISENELSEMPIDKIQAHAERAKMIVFGGLGFSGKCKTLTPQGDIYNANIGLYRNTIPTLVEDLIQTEKSEKAYFKVLEALSNYSVIIATHCPLEHWSESDYNSNFIYLSGHTHHNTFYMSSEKTVFADNQVGYYSDDYDLRYFLIDGTYDSFINYPDGIYKITYEQYIDFNIGKNIRLKKKNDGKQIILLKKDAIHMFVYYNSSNKLMLLSGGSPKRLYYDLDYYYENLDKYACNIRAIMNSYMDRLLGISKVIKSIGGDGSIHGCIVDIDYYNHIYVNPVDGIVTPYFAYDMEQKYVYKDLYTLLEEKKPSLLPGYDKWKKVNLDDNKLELQNTELTDAAVLVTDKKIYISSKIIKSIQYLLFQNIVREWNDKILRIDREETLEEIGKTEIDNSIYQSIL